MLLSASARREANDFSMNNIISKLPSKHPRRASHWWNLTWKFGSQVYNPCDTEEHIEEMGKFLNGSQGIEDKGWMRY